ncbi:MAG TPA: hypothetical protein VN493_29990 [Thermoanaerobaculia bacterium]|nr:hypothetical protein [Thermoanaerobaculia bacterium]
MAERQEEPRWNLATRIAFRFAFAYFALNFIVSLMGLLPFLKPVLPAYFDFWDAVVVWAHEEFRFRQEIDFEGRYPNNGIYGWILFLCYLALAALVTLIWSALDRNRLQYTRLHQGLRLMLRYMLALTMIGYGVIKVIPAQMTAPPPLGVLQQRVGDIFPNHILWWTVGASPAFESFTGLAELLGGVLLLVPRTTLLGALICAANMLLVFVLNMCYDVPVKLYSLQLMVMALVLTAPDLRRLADVFLFNRRVEPVRVPPLFARKWLDRLPHVLLFLYGLYAVGRGLDNTAERYKLYHPPRPPYYGIWTVEEYAVAGRDAPVSADPNRWRLVMVSAPGSLRVELMSGSWKTHPLAELSIDQPEEDVLVLNGTMDGRRTRVKLRKAALIRNDFHWIVDGSR